MKDSYPPGVTGKDIDALYEEEKVDAGDYPTLEVEPDME